MKLKSFVLVAAVAFFAACETPYRAADSGVVISPQMQTGFETQYPGATRVIWSSYDPVVMSPIDWELAGWPALDSSAYVVTFDYDRNNYYAWYDANGNWVGSTYQITDYSLLPQAVSNTLHDKYSGYNITSVNRQFQKDRTAYEVTVMRDDIQTKLLIDGDNGTIIKVKDRS